MIAFGTFLGCNLWTAGVSLQQQARTGLYHLCQPWEPPLSFWVSTQKQFASVAIALLTSDCKAFYIYIYIYDDTATTGCVFCLVLKVSLPFYACMVIHGFIDSHTAVPHFLISFLSIYCPLFRQSWSGIHAHRYVAFICLNYICVRLYSSVLFNKAHI